MYVYLVHKLFRIAQLVDDQTHGQRACKYESWQEQWENFLLQSFFFFFFPAWTTVKKMHALIGCFWTTEGDIVCLLSPKLFRIAQLVDDQTRDQKACKYESWQEQQEKFLLQSFFFFFSADS